MTSLRTVGRMLPLILLARVALPCLAKSPKPDKKGKPPELSPLDKYIQEAMRGSAASAVPASSPGSIWTTSSRLSDLGRDLRSTQPRPGSPPGVRCAPVGRVAGRR